MNYDLNFQRWQARNALRKVAAVCERSPADSSVDLSIDDSVIVNKTLETVFRAYDDHIWIIMATDSCWCFVPKLGLGNSRASELSQMQSLNFFLIERLHTLFYQLSSINNLQSDSSS